MGTAAPAAQANKQHAAALAYPAKLEKDKQGRILVRFKDFPECLTDGADEQEALTEAKDALSEAILGRLARGEAVPLPPLPRRQDRQVAPYPDAAMKLAVRIAVDAQNISATELARRLNVDEKEGRRILDPEYRTKPARMQQALAAAGQEMVITTRPIAAHVAVIAQEQMTRSTRITAKRGKATVKRVAAKKRA